MKGRPPEGGDNDRTLVYKRVGNVAEGREEGEQPGLRLHQSLDHLFLLERLVLHTSLVLSDPDNSLRAFLGGEEPGVRRGIWEKEPVNDCGHDSDQAGDNHEPVADGSVVGPPRELIGYTISKERNPLCVCADCQRK